LAPFVGEELLKVIRLVIGSPLLLHLKPLKLFYPIPFMAVKEKI